MAVTTSVPGSVSRLDDPAHHRWLQARTDDLFAFYAAAPDWRGGGFHWLDGDRRPSNRPKQLLVTSRLTYCFALGELAGRPGCADLVEHGLTALRTMFHDGEYGGWWQPDAAEPWPKQTYQHAFVVLAAATARTAGFAADDILDEALARYADRIYDPAAGLPVESFDRGWTTSEDYRGVNATMHSVEATLAASEATDDEALHRRASDMAKRVVGFAANAGWRIPEHFTSDWRPLPEYHADRRADPFRPYGVTPGHAFEWARLLLQLGEPWARQPAADLFDRAVADGWDGERGGLVYTTDRSGRPVVTERLHWPVTEAIGAACYLFRVTGEERFARWYDAFWDEAERHFVDPVRGGWIHEVSQDGRPSDVIWAGKPDLYHALQATWYARLPIAASVGASLRSATST